MAEAIKLSGEFGVEHNIDHSDGWSFPGPDTHLVQEDHEHNLDLFWTESYKVKSTNTMLKYNTYLYIIKVFL